MRIVISFKTLKVLWVFGGTISLSCSMYMGLVMLGRQNYTQQITRVPEPSESEFELTFGKLKRHKSPGFDQLPAELFKAGDRTIHYEIHILINSIWNKEELSQIGKWSLIVPI